MKALNKIYIFVLLLIVISCDNKSEQDQQSTFSVKIISPKDASFYYVTNFIQFRLEAYDSSGAWTQIDSEKWVSNLDGVFIQHDMYMTTWMSLSTPGLHKIAGYAYKGSKVAFDEVTVLVTDSLYIRLHFSNNSWTIYDVPTRYVYVMEHDKANSMFIGTLGSGLIQHKNSQWYFFTHEDDGLISNEIQCIAHDENNNIYVGDWTNNGIKKYDGLQWSHILMPDTLWDIHSIAFRNDTLWAADHRGRIIYYTNTWSTVLSQPRYFEHPGKIVFDANGILWGNSEHGGSFRYDGVTWSLLDSIGLTSCSYKLTIDKLGRILFGTCDAGLFSYDGTIWTKTDISNSSLPSNSITALCSDKNNNLWIGTDKGLAKFGPSGWTIYNTGNSPIPDDFITCLSVDDSNHVWIGTAQAITVFKNNL